jgi:addiction module HigA family antidote
MTTTTEYGKNIMGKEYIGEFRPDYAVPPGWLLEERLELREWSQAEFARRCGRSAKLISDIIAGKAPIEPETALQFEKVLDLSANVWLNLEADYQLHLAREREREQLKASVDWYKRFNINEFVKARILDRPQDDIQGTNYLLTFFGVGNVSGWNSKYASNGALARQTSHVESSNEAVSVWLRLGELAVSKQEIAEYNEPAFKDALAKIRRLSRSSVEEFDPRMKKLCNEAGVACVLVPAFKGNKLSGAAWWHQSKTPVIQLTLRGKWSDVFWFTFFHEAAHILLHSRKSTFVDEGAHGNTEFESEADKWAGDFLIAPKDWDDFIFKGNFSEASIVEFASEQEISPAIVLGRLQHESWVKWRTPLNSSLKERYDFAGI